MPTTWLPDLNVWLALTFDAHQHHPPAKAWFDALPADDACVFCRFTQQGLLRLSTNASAFGASALDVPGAWAVYDAFRGDPRIGWVDEPPDLETHWRALTAAHPGRSPHVWSDAYLAALALSAGLALVTFDKGMSQYKGVRVNVLT